MAVRRVVVAEHRQHPLDDDAGGVHRHQDLRLLLVARVARVGLAHQDRDLAARIAGAGREPLAAVDLVVVAVALDAGLDVGGVGGRHRRLGHQERGADLAVHQRPQPLLLLLLAAVAQEHFHVAGIRRRAVEHFRGPADAAHLLRQHRVFEVGQAGAMKLVVLMVARRHEHVPEAVRASLLLQLLEHGNDLPARVALVHLRPVGRHGRFDMLLHEVHDPIEPMALAFRHIEVHGRSLTLVVSGVLGCPFLYIRQRAEQGGLGPPPAPEIAGRNEMPVSAGGLGGTNAHLHPPRCPPCLHRSEPVAPRRTEEPPQPILRLNRSQRQSSPG